MGNEQADGHAIYNMHMRHLEIRRHDKDFWVESCAACMMHKEANEKARDISAYSRRVDRAWDKFEQR
jgi:hypothetical protein